MIEYFHGSGFEIRVLITAYPRGQVFKYQNCSFLKDFFLQIELSFSGIDKVSHVVCMQYEYNFKNHVTPLWVAWREGKTFRSLSNVAENCDVTVNMSAKKSIKLLQIILWLFTFHLEPGTYK